MTNFAKVVRWWFTLFVCGILSVGSLVIDSVAPAGASALPTWADFQIATSLNAGGNAYIAPISCVSASFCVAGGQYKDASGKPQAFVSTWNGTRWTDQEIAATLNTGLTPANSGPFVDAAAVQGISCVSASFCAAGGTYVDASDKYQAFVSTWNGTAWNDQEVAGSLNTDGGANVNSVSCVSSNFCVAGGSYYDASGNPQAFVSTWNGTAWTDQEVAGLNSATSTQIFNVSCVSANSCAAGGQYTDASGNSQAFVSTWSGTAWTDQEVAGSLNTGRNANVNSVSCGSANFCVAAGDYQAPTNSEHGFISVWNGTNWADQQFAASLDSAGAVAYSVSCTSASFCVVGGNYGDASGNGIAVVETWNGTNWTDQNHVAIPHSGPNVAINYVNSVSCVSASFCVAGGGDEGLHSKVFVSTWNGANWTGQEVATTLITSSALVDSVSCVSASFCVAGGYYSGASNSTQAFVSVMMMNQSTLSITSATSASALNTITLKTSGGSGTIVPVFSVKGKGCSLVGDQLKASGADICVVTAVNPSSGGYVSATSAPVSVHFSLASQRPLQVRAKRRALIHQSIALGTTGGSGNGVVNFTVSGAHCVVHKNSLNATIATHCVVRAQKTGTGPFRAAQSRPFVITFVAKA